MVCVGVGKAYCSPDTLSELPDRTLGVHKVDVLNLPFLFRYGSRYVDSVVILSVSIAARSISVPTSPSVNMTMLPRFQNRRAKWRRQEKMEASVLAELPPITRPTTMPGDGSTASSLFPYPTFDPWSFMAVSGGALPSANGSEGNPTPGTPTSNCNQSTTAAPPPPSFFGSFLSLPNSPTLPSFPMGSPNLPGFGAGGLACSRVQQQHGGTIMDSAAFFAGASSKNGVQSNGATSANGTPPNYAAAHPMSFAYPTMANFHLPPISQQQQLQHTGSMGSGHGMASYRHGAQRLEQHDDDAFDAKMA